VSNLCDTLVAEHAVIRRVLDALDVEVTRIEAGDPPNGVFILCTISFAREYVDSIHHRKEERILFPALAESGLPVGNGPLGNLVAEHANDRQIIAAVEQSLDSALTGERDAVQVLASMLRAWSSMQRSHMDNEEHLVFPMATHLLTDESKQHLERGFARVDATNATTLVRERAWANSLGHSPGTPVSEPAASAAM